MDVRGHLRDAEQRLAANEDPGAAPRLEAELLLAQVLGVSRTFFFAHPEDEVPEAAARAYRALLRRRVDGEPLAYLTGEQEFWSLSLQVNPDVLIPRPETELLVEAALDRLPVGRPSRVADIGTGSGAIALAIASERPRAEVLGTDLSPAALETARSNARRLSLERVRFAEGSWCEPLEGWWDLIASNPPYLAGDDPHLDQGDLRFEPRMALTPDGNGLSAFEAIIAGAGKRLAEGGWLLFEHGYAQGEAVRALLRAAGYTAVETLSDLRGLERVTLGRRSA